jgi:hypothetical protein
MQTRLKSPFQSEPASLDRASFVAKAGQVTLERVSARLVLSLACEQKPQFAVHLPSRYVRRYAVEGDALSRPSIRPNTAADPDETRINEGMPSGLAVVVPYRSSARGFRSKGFITRASLSLPLELLSSSFSNLRNVCSSMQDSIGKPALKSSGAL